jgi:SAM-dependent methyltransferase
VSDAGVLTRPDIRAAYASMLAEDGHDNLDAFLYQARSLFSGIDLRGKSVLEVGSGEGLMTLFASMSGAKVVSMEPELEGSRSGMIDLQRKRLAALGLADVEFLSADFNAWEPGDRTFDVVLLCNSINHLYESPHHARAHKETHRRMVEVVGKVRRATKPSGVAIASDACRYGLFMAASYLGIPRPWDLRPLTLNWRIHQNPPVWREIFLEAGFSAVDIIYPLPYRLRGLGALVQNPVTNFLLEASFTLHARA